MIVRNKVTGYESFVYALDVKENRLLISERYFEWFFAWYAIDDFDVVDQDQSIYTYSGNSILSIVEFSEEQIKNVCSRDEAKYEIDDFLQSDLGVFRFWAMKYFFMIIEKYDLDKDRFSSLQTKYTTSYGLGFLTGYIEKAIEETDYEREVSIFFIDYAEIEDRLRRKLVKDVFYAEHLLLKRDFEWRRVDLMILGLLDFSEFEVYDFSLDSCIIYYVKSKDSCLAIMINRYEDGS